MPHFSPIWWLAVGFIFYFVLMLFISLLWWVQNYMFSGLLGSVKFNFKSSWNWL